VKKPKASPSGALPSEADLLEFIQTSPGAVGKREVARAFGLSGGAKITLKFMLKKLEQDGKLERRRKVLSSAGTLPPVIVVEVVGLDRDGEAYGTPVEWDEAVNGKAPLILLSGKRAPAKGDRVLAKIEAKPAGRYGYTGYTIRSLSGRSLRVLGVYRLVKGHGARLLPIDKKARHELQVRAGDENGAINGELVEAEIVKHGAGLPIARVRERLGDMNDQRNISLIAIHHHAIPHTFMPRVLAESEALGTFDRNNREDLRDVPLITIDPQDARDHDDAVWAEPAGDGFRVIVAIADVAAYVKPGSALDKEARFRGNSVYFPDRVVPMLPERISNDLCSLREKEERPALACVLNFDAAGQKKSHRFARIIMRSAAKLSYEEAQAAIDGKASAKAEPLVARVLRPLWQAYRALMKARAHRGPLELDLPERKLVLNAKGEVDRVVTPPRLDAHKLIEEFMIQANVAAAETLESRKTPLLYRAHDVPSLEKLRNLTEFLKTIDVPLSLGQVIKPKHFNALLAKVQGQDYQNLVNEIVLRSQAQANYAPRNQGHFGLALSRYAHFTSPIRRYADLIVHRGLISAMGFGPDGLSGEDIAQLQETADMISDAERRAMAAERETIDRLIAAHMANRIGAEFRGRITGVVGAGLFVKLRDTGADGFVPVSGLGREYFVYMDTQHALIGQDTGTTFQLGDEVDVKLLEAAPVSGGMRFEMISEGRAGKPPRAGRSRKGATRGRHRR
jgi:ribonuclease R